MTQYNTLNVKLSNSQLNKLKSEIKSGTKVTLKIWLNDVRDSNDENNFLHKLLLTNTYISRLRKSFENGSSANVKLSKTQQSGGFLDTFLGQLLKTGLPLIGNVLKPLSKTVLIPWELTAAAAAAAVTDPAIRKKMFGSGCVAKVSDRGRPSDLALRTTWYHGIISWK